MPTLDAFSTDAFSMQSLTAAINKAPFKPRLLGSLNLFKEVPVTTTKVMVEEQDGKLAILPTAVRGSIHATGARTTPVRKAQNFNVPHVPYYQTILADDVQNIRAFGTENELLPLAQHVNDQLVGMRDDHEVTHEFHRVGAMKGIVLDADNSTVIYNFYTAFGTSQQTSNFVGTVADFKTVSSAIIRLIGTAMGNTPFDLIVAICGNTYFDAVVSHASTKAAYDRWMDGEYLRSSQLGPEWYTVATNGFYLHNILFLNYRGVIGDVTFIPDTEAYYTPTGVSNMYQAIVAPADFMETVNTRGLMFYAKQHRMPYDKGVELHTQSNCLMINTRPRAVIKSTYSAT